MKSRVLRSWSWSERLCGFQEAETLGSFLTADIFVFYSLRAYPHAWVGEGFRILLQRHRGLSSSFPHLHLLVLRLSGLA